MSDSSEASQTFPSAARALTEVQHDVKEAREAIAEVLDDDNALTAVCISGSEVDRAQRQGRQAPSMQLAAALLGSYERQIQSVEGALRVRPWLFTALCDMPGKWSLLCGRWRCKPSHSRIVGKPTQPCLCILDVS